jgi:hypothetical protein
MSTKALHELGVEVFTFFTALSQHLKDGRFDNYIDTLPVSEDNKRASFKRTEEDKVNYQDKDIIKDHICNLLAHDEILAQGFLNTSRCDHCARLLAGSQNLPILKSEM